MTKRDWNKRYYVTMRYGLAEWVVHWVSLGVGCSWQFDWLRGGSFTRSMTMKNGPVEWDRSSFAGVGWTKHSPSREGVEDGDLTGKFVGSMARSLSLPLSLFACLWVLLSLSLSLFARLQKWFEVKITTKNILRPIALILQSKLKTFSVWPNF